MKYLKTNQTYYLANRYFFQELELLTFILATLKILHLLARLLAHQNFILQLQAFQLEMMVLMNPQVQELLCLILFQIYLGSHSLQLQISLLSFKIFFLLGSRSLLMQISLLSLKIFCLFQQIFQKSFLQVLRHHFMFQEV